MRVSEFNPSAIISTINTLDIDAIKAQRAQDWKDLAEYRSRMLSEIKLWSTNKDEFYKKRGVDVVNDLIEMKSKQDLLAESVRYNVMPIKIKEIIKTPPMPKRHWFVRILQSLLRSLMG